MTTAEIVAVLRRDAAYLREHIAGNPDIMEEAAKRLERAEFRDALDDPGRHASQWCSCQGDHMVTYPANKLTGGVCMACGKQVRDDPAPNAPLTVAQAIAAVNALPRTAPSALPEEPAEVRAAKRHIAECVAGVADEIDYRPMLQDVLSYADRLREDLRQADRAAASWREAVKIADDVCAETAHERDVERESVNILRARCVRLTEALRVDATGLRKALARVKVEIKSRRWITEGRGDYAYDDDGYRKETGYAFDAIDKLAGDAMQESDTKARAALADAGEGA